MHYVAGWSFWGMHFFWWIFWIVAIALLFSSVTPVSPRRRETPLEILQRRYAEGRVTTEVYEERKAKLIRDYQPTNKS